MLLRPCRRQAISAAVNRRQRPARQALAVFSRNRAGWPASVRTIASSSRPTSPSCSVLLAWGALIWRS